MPSAYWPMIGGVEELTRRLALRLVATGDEVEIWTTAVEGAAAEDEVDGLLVRRFSMPMPRSTFGSALRFPAVGAAALRKVVGATRSFRPDLLHVQCFSVNGAYATAASFVARVPMIVTLQGETVMDDHDVFDRSVSLRTALRIGIKQSAAVTGCSRFVLDDAVARFGLTPEAGHVVFNGVELAEVEPLPVQIPFERFVLGLGRLVWKKGFDLLVEAFASIAPAFPDVGLVLAGDGPYRRELERRVDACRVNGRVHFTGSLDRPAVAWLMNKTEVFVMPSRLEPFGIVALEGWRAGRAIIVSSAGGAPEFVRNGYDGLVVDPADTEAMGDAIARVLDDRALRKELGERGAERVQEFAWEIVADRYRQLYRRALIPSHVAPKP